MRHLRTIAIILVLVAIAFFIRLSKNHDSGHVGHNHAAVEGNDDDHAGHDHAAVEGDDDDHAGHNHAAGEGHDDDLEQVKKNKSSSMQGMTDAGYVTPKASVVDDHDHGAGGMIEMDPMWESLVGLETDKAVRKEIESVITLPGKIKAHPDQKAIVSPLIDGSINCIFVQIGQKVYKGQELACISSPEIGMLRADYDKAGANLALTRQNFNRKKALYDEKVISERAYREIESALTLAEVNYNYAEKRLMAVGVSTAELKNPPSGHSEAAGSTTHIHAPISGVITLRNGFIGQKVDPGHVLFEIVNARTVWCEVDLFEKDLKHVEIGQLVHISLSAYPDEYFTGKLFHVGNTLDESTKTIKLLAEFNNADRKLKPGMYATTDIVTGTKTGALVIPRSAVIEDEQLKVVFVREGNAYHRHIVKTGLISGNWVEILEGLELGAIVVTLGNYQLRSKAKMGSVDPHAGHVH